LYSTTLAGERTLPETTIGAAGVNKTIAEKLQRTSIIRNFLSTKHSSETVKELGLGTREQVKAQNGVRIYF
jgi:hypothetical protein